MDSLIEPEEQLSERYLSAPWGSIGRSATLGLISGLSKLLLGVMNTLKVENIDSFHQHVMHRKEGVGLITVCNHTSTIDDPVLFSAMIPWSYFYTEHIHSNMRWSLCARELCYRNFLLGQFFQSGKTLPVERGGGLHQPVMKVAAREVSRGKWVHVFPEGRINYTGQVGPLRWGVGKLVCDSVTKGNATPIVLPFYHSGMGSILPYKGRIPRLGHKVTVIVGQPVELEDLACRCKTSSGEELALVWRDITDRVGRELRELEARAPMNPVQRKGPAPTNDGNGNNRDALGTSGGGALAV